MQKNEPILRYLLLVEDVKMLRDNNGNQKLGIVEPMMNLITPNNGVRTKSKIIYCVSNLKKNTTYYSRIVVINPSGRTIMMIEDKFDTVDEDGLPPIITVIADASFLIDEEGTYIFELLLNESKIGQQILEIAFLKGDGDE
ncbi:hypothetical protein [Paenibacillus dendritiformis]|uniref:hypothetical protein n=1 Tax=Paenibacillus dendritiformis TaxID=130049 RepID=UPI000DA844A4|nr:hypothetical protein [Paenibacillus dendritiformis]PZM61838.1 hypothetical protein DOE73_30510 [Paenibacillus dendritiformis]